MNELTREASKQTILQAISFLWMGGRGRARKSRREPQKALTGDFEMNKDDCQEQYKKDTEKMHQLDEEWQEVYQRTLAYLDADQEHIERETEKGGRYD